MENLDQELKLFSPDFIGISILSSEYEETLNIILDIAKHLNENIITIAGGVYITTKYQYAFKNKNLYFGVYGEGEYILRNLLLYLLNKADFPKEGLIYKDNNKLVVQEQVFVEDLKSFPWVDYSFIKLEHYLNRGARIDPNRPPALPTYRMITTRGCPFGCSFCQVETVSGKKVRARDHEDVVNYALIHSEEYPITDWRYSQIKSEEWSAKDISILRAYEWDQINFSPEKIENIAKLWGVSVDKLQEIRKNTRDTLEF